MVVPDESGNYIIFAMTKKGPQAKGLSATEIVIFENGQVRKSKSLQMRWSMAPTLNSVVLQSMNGISFESNKNIFLQSALQTDEIRKNDDSHVII